MRKTMTVINELIDAGYGMGIAWAPTRDDHVDEIMNWSNEKFEAKVNEMRRRKRKAAEEIKVIKLKRKRIICHCTEAEIKELADRVMQELKRRNALMGKWGC